MTWIVPLIAILLSPFLWMVFGRPRYLREVSGVSQNKLSVIIPARDEEHNIEKLLKSLESQKDSIHEIIVVDDQSSDETADVARKFGATVVSTEALPDGWRGKSWACQTGAGHAQADWLLFVDADLEFGSTAMDYFNKLTHQKDQCYSVCPKHEIREPYEELSSVFNLIMVQGVNAFGLSKHTKRAEALFGQCLLISTQAYEKVGGHSAVKGITLENLNLAKMLEVVGVSCKSFLGGDLLMMRMFPEGFNQLWSSWQKGFVSGAGSVDSKVLLYSSLWLSGAMFCIVSLSLLLVDTSLLYVLTVLVAYLIYASQCVWANSKIGNFSVWNGILFPVALLFYQTLFFYSLIIKKRGKKTLWKGREV